MSSSGATGAANTASQVVTMKSAAKKGVPFCEKCAKSGALAAAKAEEEKYLKSGSKAPPKTKTEQSETLKQASKNGTPFCEKCAQSAAEAQAKNAAKQSNLQKNKAVLPPKPANPKLPKK